MGVGDDAKVRPPPDWIEKRLARVPAQATALVDREETDAFVVTSVEVVG